MADQHARHLRKTMTPHEVRLWLRLRALRPQGFHFRRQVPRGGYIVDFACLKVGLAIEIDGEQHGFPSNQARDVLRDEALGRSGLAVLRFWNAEIKDNIEGVVETVIACARARRLPDEDPDNQIS